MVRPRVGRIVVVVRRELYFHEIVHSFFDAAASSCPSPPSRFLLFPKVDQLTLSSVSSILASISALNVLLSSSPDVEPNLILLALLKLLIVDFAKFFKSTFISSASMLSSSPFVFFSTSFGEDLKNATLEGGGGGGGGTAETFLRIDLI